MNQWCAILLLGMALYPAKTWADTPNVWTAGTLSGGSHIVLDLKFNPRSPDTLYAATLPGTVFRSADRGATWIKLSSLDTTISGSDHTVLSLAINPRNPAVIYAGTINGIYKTRDRGTTWTQSGLAGLQINRIQIMPVDTSRIYAGTPDSLMRTTTGGVSWNRVRVDTTVATLNITTLAVNPLHPDTLYVGTDGNGVYRSRNGGSSWTQVNSGLDNLRISTLIVHPTQTDTLYAATYGGGIFRSTSGATVWETANRGLENLDMAGLAIAPSQPAILYAGSKTGQIFRSSDHARTWFEITANLTTNVPVTGLLVQPDSAQVIYAGLDEIYRNRQQGLVPRLLLETGTAPSAVTAADLDGNGQLDAVVANTGSGTLSLFLNQEQGTFFSSRKLVAGGEPVSLVAGDLNKDGAIDLVVGNRASKVISVLFNNSSGDFPARLDLFVGNTPGALALADIDGDGLPDILAATRSPGNGVSLFKNLGSGQFSSQQEFSVGRDPVGIAVGDFNGDGLLDAMTADAEDGRVSLLTNQGGGRFSTPQPIAIGGHPAVVIARDFDKDGQIDAAVITGGTEELVLLRNRGKGSFSVEHNALSFTPLMLRTGDLDRDTYPDLIISGQGQIVQKLINDGRGKFPLPSQTFDETTTAQALALADLDGDGDPDLLAVQSDTRSLFIHRNDLPQAIKSPAPPRNVTAEDVQADLGGRIRIRWQMPRSDEETNRVTRYRVFRADAKQGPFAMLEEQRTDLLAPTAIDSSTIYRSYQDSTAAVGRTYYYTLVSLSPDLTSSTPSDTVSATSRAQPFFDFQFSQNGIYHVRDTLQVNISLVPLDYAVSGISLYLNYDPRGLTLLDADPAQSGLQPILPSQSILQSSQVLENRLYQSLPGAINYSVGSFTAPDSARISLGSLRFVALRDTVVNLTLVDSPQVNRRTAVIERGSGAVVLPYLGTGRYAISTHGIRLDGRVLLQGHSASKEDALLRIDVRKSNGTPFPDSLAYRPPNDLDQNAANGIQLYSDASGKFSLVQVPAGKYALFVKSFHTLRARVQNDSLAVSTGAPASFHVYWRSSLGTVVTDTLRGGDANDDNRVNLADFGILAAQFGATGVTTTSAGWPADFNGDGAIDLADFGILASNFGEVGMGATLAFKPAIGPEGLALVPQNDHTYALKLTASAQVSGFSAEIAPAQPGDPNFQVLPGTDLEGRALWINRQGAAGYMLVAAHLLHKTDVFSVGAEIARIRTGGLQPVFQNIQIIDPKGQLQVTGLLTALENPIPKRPALYPAYPNPFNPSTTIRFDVSEPADVVLEIYSLTGQKIRTLLQETKTPGTYAVTWNGKDTDGRPLASGVYFYRIAIGAFRDVNKLILLK